jgi:hypothetical protein
MVKHGPAAESVRQRYAAASPQQEHFNSTIYHRSCNSFNSSKAGQSAARSWRRLMQRAILPSAHIWNKYLEVLRGGLKNDEAIQLMDVNIEMSKP